MSLRLLKKGILPGKCHVKRDKIQKGTYRFLQELKIRDNGEHGLMNRGVRFSSHYQLEETKQGRGSRFYRKRSE